MIDTQKDEGGTTTPPRRRDIALAVGCWRVRYRARNGVRTGFLSGGPFRDGNSGTSWVSVQPDDSTDADPEWVPAADIIELPPVTRAE